MNSIPRTTDIANSSAGQADSATGRKERLLTPETIAAVDQWLDEADVFAKGYWQYVDGKLTTVGLRIGQDWDRVVAFFGDTVVRHEDGSHSVLSAKDAAELVRLRAEAQQLQNDITGACLARYEEERENARLRLAWKSARERAQAYGEGILRHVEERDSYAKWLEQEQGVTLQLRAQVAELEGERHSTNEALSDAAETIRAQRDRIAELEATAAQVARFCAARAEYVDNINNCSPSNDRDYWRWNGHAEARRQLSQLLGLPVGWPAEGGAR
ncbi:hypothetical protein MBT42_18385 [Streptomyces sp. MBT42]|uniref:hypothetical protein n=1 Tax=Streptomyces sp. MBT42 TaxID=1488373 RepID=UPI001E423B97|nr:hypothetical protein [Streptomyces sp. MBT42]MCD2461945.1 hypothetical protein [Streptomyces sp. MBT42]MCD2465525.1 hypothetical protein [Streptomyces sp. MBT42]